MKLSNLMIASLGAVALVGCGDGTKSSDEVVTPDPVVYSVEDTLWNIQSAGSTSGLSTTAIADIVAYHFDSDSDMVKIYETSYYTTSSYSIEGDDSDTDIGEVTFDYEDQEVTCEFDAANNTLTLSSCTTAEFDVTGANGLDPESAEAEDLVGDIEAKPGEGTDGKSVLIKDTSTENSGKIRYTLSDELAQGKLSFNVLYNTDEDQTFYATLYDNTTSSSNTAVDIGLKSSGVQIRQGGSLTSIDGNFTTGEWVNVVVTWDSNTSKFNLTVGKQELGELDFNNSGANVAAIEFKIGTNGNKTATDTPVYVDDFHIYSDIAGTAVVHEDNFDDYAEGYVFGTGETYSDSSAEATASSDQNATEDDGSEPTDPEGVTDNFDSYTVGALIEEANSAYSTTANNSTTFATISDDFANSASNSLRLSDEDGSAKPVVARAFSAGAADAGSVTTSVYIPTEGYDSATYLYLGSSASASSGNRFTEVVFTSSAIKFRDASGSQVELASYSKDTWIDVTISWDGVDADGKYPITVTIDDTVYTEASGAAMFAQAADGTPTLMAWYVGDNGSTATYSYFDDIDSELF
ncbi:hypothetical protein [Vibrio hippocampi]|uniref:Dystroglycan-type cadherin-like protein n=1 Tax=Vibrio hippocampi TaxID=654686 RepID=A0ABM8ZPM9_9VIBR|nr:hypothetical protein [Vibrio hippocampi]CAH0530385.1 hypothetical protein VHP8226_04028 [Vibrio hippocampi]